MTLVETAIAAARSGGEVLVANWRNLPHGSVEEKTKNDFVTHADRESEERIVAAIRGAVPRGRVPRRGRRPSPGARGRARVDHRPARRDVELRGGLPVLVRFDRGMGRRRDRGRRRLGSAPRGDVHGRARRGRLAQRHAAGRDGPQGPRRGLHRDRLSVPQPGQDRRLPRALQGRVRRGAGDPAGRLRRARPRLRGRGRLRRLLRVPPRALGRRGRRADDRGGRRADHGFRRREGLSRARQRRRGSAGSRRGAARRGEGDLVGDERSRPSGLLSPGCPSGEGFAAARATYRVPVSPPGGGRGPR